MIALISIDVTFMVLTALKLYIKSLVILKVNERKWSKETLVGNKTINQRQSNEINTHKMACPISMF